MCSIVISALRPFFRLPRQAAVAAAASALICCGGCHFTESYRAGSLPPELAAPSVRSAQSINLSRIAAAHPDGDAIRPGDVLNVSIATGLETEAPVVWPLRVADDGTLQVPLVGPVLVGGLDPTQAELQIRNESVRRGVYRAPQVSVLFRQRKSNRVTMAGEVNRPGLTELHLARSSLVDALIAAGGLTAGADTVVEIRTPPPQPPAFAPASAAAAAVPLAPVRTVSYNSANRPAAPATSVRIDLAALEASGAPAPALADGSIVTVLKRAPRTVDVIGLVRKPGKYEMPADADLHLLGALALAGGRTLQIADRVHIVRTPADGRDPVLIRASIRRAKHDPAENIRLAHGDVVSIEETPATFSVELLRSFLRFGFTGAIPGT